MLPNVLKTLFLLSLPLTFLKLNPDIRGMTFGRIKVVINLST